MGICGFMGENLPSRWQDTQPDLRVTVENGALSNAFPPGLQKGIFLGMDAQAGSEADATTIATVTTGTWRWFSRITSTELWIYPYSRPHCSWGDVEGFRYSRC